MWWFAVSEALACGGFFCNAQEPVEQVGETIVFEVGGGTVTTHVVVQFEGRAKDFAWVLPAPGVPEVFLSSEALFDAVQVRTEPVLQLQYESDCYTRGATADAITVTDAVSSSASPPSAGGVEVLDTVGVGPYEGFVLSATDGVALTQWLQDNAFAVPDTFASASSPYLQDGMNFLALKLNKTAEVGDLPPLGVTWDGDRPSVPLTLTSVAAQPDMPLSVYILGESRAVPLNYLHVQMNPLVYDWFGRGQNWLERVGRAADEAGGHGFATTYAGPTGPADLGCRFYSTDGLALIPSALDWFRELPYHGFSGTPELMQILLEFVPPPNGVDPVQFYNNTYAYEAAWAALDATFDPIAATAALDERIVAPCTAAEDILEGNPYLTRLTSTISPEEMNVDPSFGFNATLPDVSNVLSATYRDNCDGTATFELPGGFELGVGETEDYGPTDAWIEEHLQYNALVIEQLSEEGPGEVLVDHRAELIGDILQGCGCATGANPGLAGALVLLGVALRRRRLG